MTAPVGSTGRSIRGRELLIGLLFLVPALAVLVTLVVYPIVFTVVRSFFGRAAGDFVGLANYREVFTRPATLRALRNNAIWVVVAPSLVTSLGLVLAVLLERVRLATAFKVVIFMPMAISFLAAGVIFRLAYQRDPDQGLLNAAIAGVLDVVREPGPYPGARPAEPARFPLEGGAIRSAEAVSTGSAVPIGLVAVRPALVPEQAVPARAAAVPDGTGLAGTVWSDFTPGAAGVRGEIDPGELGLPGVQVRAIATDGSVAGTASTAPDGTYRITGLQPGEYVVELDADTFREPFGGYAWLGPTLVTPAVIGAFIWIWAGFAMVVISAGLAAIPREALEAARVDGGNEWQVFRHVTVPLLAPVLLVVAVTLAINVLKIFDLVLIIPPGSSQDDATVVALEMWRVSFGGELDQGLGSALAVLLFVLVVPAMALNLRRFRSEP